MLVLNKDWIEISLIMTNFKTSYVGIKLNRQIENN